MLKKTFAIFALALIPLACSAQKPLVIGKDSKCNVVRVKRSVSFTIALEGNPSTGYSWNVIGIDTAKIRQAGESRFLGRDSLPGSSGTYFFDFKPVAKGVSTITLAYFRTWEREVAPLDSFFVTVKVR